jgi:hypothetical protein
MIRYPGSLLKNIKPQYLSCAARNFFESLFEKRIYVAVEHLKSADNSVVKGGTCKIIKEEMNSCS